MSGAINSRTAFLLVPVLVAVVACEPLGQQGPFCTGFAVGNAVLEGDSGARQLWLEAADGTRYELSSAGPYRVDFGPPIRLLDAAGNVAALGGERLDLVDVCPSGNDRYVVQRIGPEAP